MGDILNKDIEAVMILVKQMSNAIKSAEYKYDKSFVSVVQNYYPATNTYIIKDEDGTERKTFCAIPNVTLKTGQNVWVKIPCGNRSKMHIYGIVQ